jgi:uncharacterized membrane protein YfcA
VAIVAVVVAGLVYGFAGFGAALVAVPVLAALYSPADAVGIFALSALASLVTVAPRAWREGDRQATAHLLASAVVTLPVGLYVLRNTPSGVLRWLICLLVLGTLAALILGWRRQGADRMSGRVAVGAATGLIGGATGLTGPVVVLFQLSGREEAGRIRANITLFLSLLSVVMLPLLVISGVLGPRQAAVGPHPAAVLRGRHPYGSGALPAAARGSVPHGGLHGRRRSRGGRTAVLDLRAQPGDEA